MELVVSADPNPTLVDAARVVLATNQRPHFGNARQVGGVKAADRAGPDNEDAFQTLLPTTGAHREAHEIKSSPGFQGQTRILKSKDPGPAASPIRTSSAPLC